MRHVANLLLSLAAIMGALLWCVVCVTACLWVVNLLPFDGYLFRGLMLAAGGLGMFLALWSMAKATGGRL